MSVMQELTVGWKAARQATRLARAERAARTRVRARGVRRVLGEHGLTIAAIACFIAAAATVAIPLALVTAGVGLFVIEWRVGE